MSPILNQLLPAIAAALPSNLLSTAENCIIVHPNSLHFGQHMGGGILISQDSDNVVTISYQSTNHGSLRVLLWGKDLFACINGISLALRGDEFSASSHGAGTNPLYLPFRGEVRKGVRSDPR